MRTGIYFTNSTIILTAKLITRLLSQAGIPKLRKRAKDLKFKGKGHEVRYMIHSSHDFVNN
jgi:hypothetical protein